MTPWWIPVVAALVGGLIGVAGSLATQLIRARTDRQDRNDQVRLDAYGEFARATWDVSEAISLYLGYPDEPRRQALVQAVHELVRQASLIDLVASPVIRDVTEQLTGYAMTYLMELASSVEEPSMERVGAGANELGKRYGNVIAAARDDLRTR